MEQATHRPLAMPGAAAALAPVADVGDFVALMKPRVMSLVVFSAFAGMVAAPGVLHPVLAAVALLCVAACSGGAGAINMWYERDLDALMSRTSDRPLPAGRLEPGAALGFGSVLVAGGVSLMGLAVNWVAAALLLVSVAFYVFVYTVWLKRRTPQNIVIGGAAGAFPPVVGWAAVTGDVGLPAVGLFAIIFMWTPPHFWSLALYRRADYAAAGVPMMPVVAGERETRRQILTYAAALAPLSLAPWLIGAAGMLYGVVAALLGIAFVAGALAVWREAGDRAARWLFAFSILYLFALFTALIVDRLLMVG